VFCKGFLGGTEGGLWTLVNLVNLVISESCVNG
jgi:hypothetical protein